MKQINSLKELLDYTICSKSIVIEREGDKVTLENGTILLVTF